MKQTLHKLNGVFILLFALAMISPLFFLQESIGLNLSDEGFLWYGAIRTAYGDIPLRDFQSYDPGRYYWVAAWFLLSGQQGIMALRFSVALFQVMGLFLGLLAVKRAVASWWPLGLVGVLLIGWMLPRHKLFECSLSMAAVYIAVHLIEKPSSKQYFIAGVFVGLTAFMGRNHGLYTFLTFFLLILFLRFKLAQRPLFKHLGLWSGGIIVGYAPMLFMMAFIPGLFSTFIDGLKFLFRLKGDTNLPLPIPWPWAVNYTQMTWLNAMSSFFLGVFFILLPLFYLLNTISAFFAKRDDIPRKSLLIASTAVGVFYMQHAFSRADLAHLGQSIHPFLLGLIALPCAYSFQRRRVLVGILTAFMLAGTIFAAVIPANPFLRKLRFKDRYIQYELNGDLLWLPKGQATYLDTIKQLVERHVSPREGMLIAPHSPGLYTVLQRKSPIWATYLLFPETEKKQMEIINDLIEHHVNWAILTDRALDGRDELRFRNTHPLVWQYLMEEFEQIETPNLPRNQQFLHRKGREIENNL